MNWYYSLNGSQQGPASDEQLASLTANGTLSSATLIWKEGMADWQTLATVRPDLVQMSISSAPQMGGVSLPPAQKDIVVQQMREGVLTGQVGQLNYAGFWIRAGAKILDNLIVIFAILLILGIVGGVLYAAGLLADPANSEEPPVGFWVLMILYYVLIFSLPIVYSAVLVAKDGATWGKSILGLKVVDAEGNPISRGKSWGRAFADLINGFTCAIGYIIAGFDEQKRALHDHICNTRVIKTR
jgi:uncharacterized RDD family membrane protein YckC